jgi:acyl carrier protein
MTDETYRILIEVLGLDAQTRIEANTRLLGQLPEFDSMAVVAVLTAFEEQFGIVIDDDEVDASIFETAGSLATFVERKLSRS